MKYSGKAQNLNSTQKWGFDIEVYSVLGYKGNYESLWSLLGKIVFLLLIHLNQSARIGNIKKQGSGIPGEMGVALHCREFHRASRDHGRKKEGEKVRRLEGWIGYK